MEPKTQIDIRFKFTNANNHPDNYIIRAGIVKPGMVLYPIKEDDNQLYFIGSLPSGIKTFVIWVQAEDKFDSRVKSNISIKSINYPFDDSIPIRIYITEEISFERDGEQVSYRLDDEGDINEFNKSISKSTKSELDKIGNTLSKRIIINTDYPFE